MAVLGIGLFLVALFMLIDPMTRKVSIAGLFFGPPIAIRGLVLLRREKARFYVPPELKRALAVDDETEEGEDLEGPVVPRKGLLAHAWKADAVAVQVKCDACGKDYVYFPSTDPQLAEEFLTKGCNAAPCPYCGVFQQHMLRLARGHAPRAVAWPLYVAVILFLIGAGLFFFLMTSPPPDARALWIVEGTIASGALALSFWWHRRVQAWDPNTLPRENRFKLGTPSPVLTWDGSWRTPPTPLESPFRWMSPLGPGGPRPPRGRRSTADNASRLDKALTPAHPHRVRVDLGEAYAFVPAFVESEGEPADAGKCVEVPQKGRSIPLPASPGPFVTCQSPRDQNREGTKPQRRSRNAAAGNKPQTRVPVRIAC